MERFGLPGPLNVAAARENCSAIGELERRFARQVSCRAHDGRRGQRRCDGVQFGVACDRRWWQMTVENTARDVPRGSTLHADVCVIGSGAAGITIAHELDGTHLDVLVVEAGGLKRDLSSERDVFHIEHLGMPYLNPEAPRARCFGGSTNLWFGRSRRSIGSTSRPAVGSRTAAGRSHTTRCGHGSSGRRRSSPCRSSTRSIRPLGRRTRRSRRSTVPTGQNSACSCGPMRCSWLNTTGSRSSDRVICGCCSTRRSPV